MDNRRHNTKLGNEEFVRAKQYEEKRPYDIIQIEKFLYYIDMVDRYLVELSFLD